jgi:hypothetical protein
MHEQGLEVKVELRQPRPRSYAGASVVSDGFNLPPRGAPCNLATTRQTHFTTLRPIPILSAFVPDRRTLYYLAYSSIETTRTALTSFRPELHSLLDRTRFYQDSTSTPKSPSKNTLP